MEVGEFLLSEPHKSLSFRLISICGYVSVTDLTSASVLRPTITSYLIRFFGALFIYLC